MTYPELRPTCFASLDVVARSRWMGGPDNLLSGSEGQEVTVRLKFQGCVTPNAGQDLSLLRNVDNELSTPPLPIHTNQT